MFGFERLQRVGVVHALVGRSGRNQPQNRQDGSIGIDFLDDSSGRGSVQISGVNSACEVFTLRVRSDVCYSRGRLFIVLTGASACPLKSRTAVSTAAGNSMGRWMILI